MSEQILLNEEEKMDMSYGNYVPMTVERLAEECLFVEFTFQEGERVKGFCKHEAIQSLRFKVGKSETYAILVYNVGKNGEIDDVLLNFNAMAISNVKTYRKYNQRFKDELTGGGEVKKSGKSVKKEG